jgi:hypothetical protein
VAIVDQHLKCMLCGRVGRDTNDMGACRCGASNWIDADRPYDFTRRAPAPPRPPQADVQGLAVPAIYSPVPPMPAPSTSSPRIEPVHLAPDGFADGTDIEAPIVDDFVGARINELLGGIKRGALLLIAGAAGAGKSTATADLAAVVAEHWAHPDRGPLRVRHCPIYWMDADQNDPSLIRQLFLTAKKDDIFTQPGRVKRLVARVPFEEALARVPSSARVVVFDSLETWGGTQKRQLEVLFRLREHAAWLKVMIAGTNARGGIAGEGALERADDVTVYAHRTAEGCHELRYTKRRWQPSPSALARGAGVPAPPPEPAFASPAPAAAPPASAAMAAPSPDFSRDFVALAAGWGVRELEGYKAELRSKGVPRDSIEGWLAAVREAREALEVEPDTDDEPPHLLH